MGSKNWIEKATAKHKGSFSAEAKKDGKSTAELADEEQNASGKEGRKARLAKLLISYSKGKK